MLWSLSIDNATIEDILDGSGEDLVLASFVDDARQAAAGPVPVPSAELASMLGAGISTGSHVTAATAAVTTTSRSRRMPIAAILTALPFAAKAALGVGVAAAAVGSAGAVGVLPDPVNNAVTGVISAVTPLEFPDNGTTGRNGLGEGISTDARDDTAGVDGGAVSADARDRQPQAERPGPDASGAAGQPQVPVELPSQASNGAATGGGSLPEVVPDQVPLSIPTPPVSVPVTQGPPAQTPPVSTPSVPTPGGAGSSGSARSGR
jgi:hypothetical protein